MRFGHLEYNGLRNLIKKAVGVRTVKSRVQEEFYFLRMHIREICEIFI
jgi:hypothetical protein